MAEIIPAWWGRAEAGSPYRPSNGTEGACFHEALCSNCARDKNMSEGKSLDDCAPEEVCHLIADSFAFDVTDPRYPAEWIHGADGRPTCTAFWPFGEPLPRPRCTRTQDMFTPAPLP